MGTKEELSEIKRQSLEKVSTLIITAFGLIAALAWNTAIQKLFTVLFGSQSSLSAEILYAVFVTIIAVVAAIYIARLAGAK